MQSHPTGAQALTLRRLQKRARIIQREQGIRYNPAQEIAAREAGFPHWKAAKSALSAAAPDHGAAHPLIERAMELGADRIEFEVRDGEADPVRVRFRIFGQYRLQPAMSVAEVDSLVSAVQPGEIVSNATALRGGLGQGMHHVVFVAAKPLGLRALRMEPRSMAVLDALLRAGPGVVFISAPGGRDAHPTARAIFDYACSSAGADDPRYELLPEFYPGEPDHDMVAALEAAVLSRGAKAIVPMAGGSVEMSVSRLRRSFMLPPRLLASPDLTSGLVFQRSLQRLCPACALTAPAPERSLHRERREYLARLAQDLPGAQLRFEGPGCPACNGRGAIGLRHLVQVQIATSTTAAILDPESPAQPLTWLNPEPGADRTPSHNTLRAQAQRALAAGEVDPLDVHEQLLESELGM